MAEVTVSELAQSVGTSEDRLLSQMKEAGLSHDTADQVVSDSEKQQLLAFLKDSHGEGTAAPKKITLRRKTTTTLKTGSGSARKTINVEVRKKRTYVKRDEAEVEDTVEEEVEAPKVEEAPVEVVVPAAPAAPTTATTRVDDIEEKRLAAIKSRRAEEAKEAERAKKVKEEKLKPAEAPAKGAADAGTAKAKEDDDKSKYGRKKGRLDEEGEETPRPKKTKRAGSGPKKASRLDLLADADELDDVVAGKKISVGKRTAKPSIKLVNKHKFKMPTKKIIHEVALPANISVADLAQQMKVKGGEVVKQLMKLGVMTTINQSIDQETAQLVVEELGHTFRFVSENEVEDKLEQELQVTTDGEQVSRAPIVTVMGHVDHGKTSLLDYIRESKVASGEAGGITQHIGAYRVKTGHGEITFLDTPGHAAFTAMRARGAQCTDVVVLVVAADDGVMPQTEEAIQHSKAAGVPIVVAINKCDKESADPERVKNELSAKDVIPEDWGGDTQFIPVSAHTGDGVEALLDAISLQAEMLELKAVEDTAAKGVVVESRVEVGRGVVATILVQQGLLKTSDILLAGQSFGRVRAMTNELGEQVKEAGPSTPVEILGLDSAPAAGDEFVVVPDERKAKEVALHRSDREKEERHQRTQAASLENMFSNMGENEKKILPIVIKTDVRGSLEAIQSALMDMGNEEVQVNLVSVGVGGITENDVNLALTSGAIIIGFNVRADSSARKTAERENVEVRYYSIIYQLLDEVKSALSGMLSPERVEEILGIADVRDTFRSPKFGQVAGCMVVEGTVYRSKPIRVLRDNIVIYEGELESLRRFKDDVAEVRNGTECGIGVKDYDVKVGDQIEVYDVKEVARHL